MCDEVYVCGYAPWQGSVCLQEIEHRGIYTECKYNENVS